MAGNEGKGVWFAWARFDPKQALREAQEKHDEAFEEAADVILPPDLEQEEN